LLQTTGSLQHAYLFLKSPFNSPFKTCPELVSGKGECGVEQLFAFPPFILNQVQDKLKGGKGGFSPKIPTIPLICLSLVYINPGIFTITIQRRAGLVLRYFVWVTIINTANPNTRFVIPTKVGIQL